MKLLDKLGEDFRDYTSWWTGQGACVYKDFKDKQGNDVCVLIGCEIVQVLKELSGEGYMNTDRFDWCNFMVGAMIEGDQIMGCSFTEFGADVRVLDKAHELFDEDTLKEIEYAFRKLENQY